MSTNTHKYSKGYNIIEFSDKVGWDSSARDWARALINTLEDASIRILDYWEDRNFCDFKVDQHGDIITYRVRPGGEITIRAHESASVCDETKDYENLWEDLNDYCWFGKYFDLNGNKKLVYISKELTGDAEEADEVLQELIPEPYTKFVFGGSVDRVTADLEGWQELTF